MLKLYVNKILWERDIWCFIFIFSRGGRVSVFSVVVFGRLIMFLGIVYILSVWAVFCDLVGYLLKKKECEVGMGEVDRICKELEVGWILLKYIVCIMKFL